VYGATDSAPIWARALAALKNYRELVMARWPSGPLALGPRPLQERMA
jgi:hypothetical protein